VDLIQDLGDLLVGGGRQRMEDRGLPRSGTAEDAIEHERVEMDIGQEGFMKP